MLYETCLSISPQNNPGQIEIRRQMELMEKVGVGGGGDQEGDDVLVVVMMKSTTVVGTLVEGMRGVRTEKGEMLTKPFLNLCSLILPVLDKLGPAVYIVKSDVGNNLSRLEQRYSSAPSRYNLLSSIVQAEVEANKARASSSCTTALVWLTRSMDFLVELFHNLNDHPDWSMPQSCVDSYNRTLKKWHNWFATSSFMVAIQMVPERKRVMEIIGGSGDVKTDSERFCKTFAPLLEQNHEFLAAVGLDDL